MCKAPLDQHQPTEAQCEPRMQAMHVVWKFQVATLKKKEKKNLVKLILTIYFI